MTGVQLRRALGGRAGDREVTRGRLRNAVQPVYAILLAGAFGIGSVCAQQTTIALSTSANPAVFGSPITLTATVTPAAATGAVTFYDGSSILGIKTLAGGKAVLTAGLVDSGTRSLKAYYGGNATYAASTSAAIAETVNSVPANGFQAPVGYSVLNGLNPGKIAMGDFNGDGKADLVLADADAVNLLLGNGDGTFQPAVYYYASSSNTRAVAVGDFNGDGKADLAVANFGGTVSILLGNGDGTFQGAVDYAAGTFPVSIAVGDFNGDGNVDLAVADGTQGTVNVLIGNGNGTFQAPVPYASGYEPTCVAAGDFNGDGKVDLAVTNYAGASISVLLGNGNGTFQPAVTYGGVAYPTSVAVGDFNGDGKADLAVANGNFTGYVSVYLGNGDGTFQTGPSSSVGLFPHGLAVGDFDGDGKTDLAVGITTGSTVATSTGNDFALLLGNGDGTFRTAVTYTGYSFNALAVGDFNGDGRTDVASANADGFATVLLGGNATQLMLSAQPANGLVEITLPPLVVKVEDQNGNLVDSWNASVTLTSNPAGISSTAAVVNGTVTFSSMVFNAAGTYTLTASSSGLESAISNSFSVVAGKLAFTVQPANGIQGSTIPVVVVQVQDSAGNLVTTSSASVTISSTPPGLTSTQPAMNGVATFSGFYFNASGAYELAATSPGLASALSSVFNIIPLTYMPATRVGVFRYNTAFLEDSIGSAAYNAGQDRYIPSFTGPGGFVTGDAPVAGDWTGDGRAKVGIYRASTGQWFLDANNDGVYDAGDYTYAFGGLAGDMPFVGDWSGLGKSCIGIYRSVTSMWLLDLNCNGKFDDTPADAFFPFGGLAGDVPVVGSVAGGIMRVGVVRKYAPGGVPQGDPFFWVWDAGAPNAGNSPQNHPPAANAFAFGGLPGDVFVTGDWWGTGTSTAGVYRNGYWVLDAALPGAAQVSHQAGLAFGYGGLRAISQCPQSGSGTSVFTTASPIGSAGQ